ncbi:neuronal pentraxin-2-like [Bufo bufo]|uniref:neuronal pentraxin-2-like n=1 Tax=Bufo bufo TaxID=8384 RepID=UPI001ABE27F9|nr:neuronal pentraxin-2-like [Bufo bufo]
MILLLTGIICLLVFATSNTIKNQEKTGERFVCTALPPDATPGCPMPGFTGSPEEELRTTVIQLRETVLQQKETIGNQKETIRELTAKLTRCESLAEDGKHGSWKKLSGKAGGKDTMGDLPRDPGQVIDQLGRTMQTLKDRLENLEYQLRSNVSYSALPSDLREMLQRRLGDLEHQLLNKVAELEDEKSLLHNESAAHRHRTESALSALLERVSELEKVLLLAIRGYAEDCNQGTILKQGPDLLPEFKVSMIVSGTSGIVDYLKHVYCQITKKLNIPQVLTPRNNIENMSSRYIKLMLGRRCGSSCYYTSQPGAGKKMKNISGKYSPTTNISMEYRKGREEVMVPKGRLNKGFPTADNLICILAGTFVASSPVAPPQWK